MFDCIEYKPIGIIKTPFKEKAPYQYFASKAEGKIEIFKEYEKGLEGIENFQRILVIFHFHKMNEKLLKVRRRIDGKIKGIFATRAPTRPNAIGISWLDLMRRDRNILYVKGVDMIDGTPVIDIKVIEDEL
ncbi:MAG: tRNA (N6-threonylcarbamoyladenosine(37)-N6)-methyltransferase TrmO [Thermoplasmata archaeon]|nr:tRNA (N6-threonylcarbamoyladenosine(37)-N6)-methyltransferase TrmO [Thermoplasmata archaeon]